MSPNEFRYLIFDIDGTLIDPWVGVCQSIAHACEVLGFPYNRSQERAWFVGPPLRQTFQALFPDRSRSEIDEALRIYRERFESDGIQECTLYNGIHELLARAQQTRVLFVATARIQKFTDLMLQHFQIAQCFKGAYGTGLDGSFEDKSVLLNHLVKMEGIPPEKCLMIGDRRHDIRAAHEAGMAALGVTYGYGSEKELREAGAEYLAGSIEALAELLI